MPQGGDFRFARYRVDPRARLLFRDDVAIPLAARPFDFLLILLTHAGSLVTKDALIAEIWRGIAVADNTLARQAMHARNAITDKGQPHHFEAIKRLGYRFVTPVTRSTAPSAVTSIDTQLSHYRIWVEGRAWIEGMSLVDIERACAAFAEFVVAQPNDPRSHVGLASASALKFEATRADETPNREVLQLAADHAERACQLNSQYGEAWATIGFVRQRQGNVLDAIAALSRAVSLEPDNYRHWIRLAHASWGEARRGAARRALELLPGSPLAIWLIASVYIARGVFEIAEREIVACLDTVPVRAAESARSAPVALYWLLGLLYLARGARDEARKAFARELALEASGHLYAREIAANTWYAIGATDLCDGKLDDARASFQEAIKRLPRHPMARAGLAILDPASVMQSIRNGEVSAAAPQSIDAAFAQAAVLIHLGNDARSLARAATMIGDVLAVTPAGSGGWTLAIDPLLNVERSNGVWTGVLAQLRDRAT